MARVNEEEGEAMSEKTTTRLPRAVMSAVRRRAHELAMRQRDALVEQMTRGLQENRLAPADIERWEPESER